MACCFLLSVTRQRTYFHPGTAFSFTVLFKVLRESKRDKNDRKCKPRLSVIKGVGTVWPADNKSGGGQHVNTSSNTQHASADGTALPP